MPQSPLSDADPAHCSTFEIQVGDEHLDYLGHVNHAEYVRMLESARTAFYLEAGLPIGHDREPPIGTVVVNLNVDFRAECMSGDRLRITTQGIRRGRSSFTLEQHVTRDDGSAVVDATCTSLVMDLTSRAVLPVPESLDRVLPAPQDR